MLGEKLKSIWHKIIGRDPRMNDDGTMTTKHGRHIIPYSVEVTGSGGIQTNVADFISQPRVREIAKQLDAVDFGKGDSVSLDVDTGDFYLHTAEDDQNPDTLREPLGQIDVELEEGMLKHALQMKKMKYLFGDCSPSNPIVLDESTGRVYPANAPEKTRGFVKLGPTVHR